ncbi:MAG TPA: hypothetical protein VMV10_18665 [Pirellulales bacterium]|nr:hypothetical protein [Pirellulales bacterium]
MPTSSTLKLKNCTRRTSSLERRREGIARKAAFVSRDWPAAERAQRAALAEQMQRRLFASLASAAAPLQSVA